MNSRNPRTSRRAGMALITAMIFIAVALLVLAALTTRYVEQRVTVSRFEDYNVCFDGVEAAVSRARVEVESGMPGRIGLAANWTPVYDAHNVLRLPSFNHSAAMPAGLAGIPDLEYMAFAVRWMGDGRDSNGDGTADSQAERDLMSIHAAARYNGVERRVEVVNRFIDVNVWRNAIFAGNGQAGGLVNGNVAIFGSVHLLGANLLAGSSAISALDMSGTSLVGNNYSGMPAGLAARVPPLRRTVVNGEDVATLDAVLRVRRGRVSLSGNAHVGRPQTTGQGIKSFLDAVYVQDGWGGNQITPDGGRNIPHNVYSDNGHTHGYDLGDRVSMPMLSDPWRNPDGSRVMNPHTGTWYTHAEYFSEVLLASPTVRTDGVFSGNMTLNVRNNSSYFWNATTGQVLTGSAADAAVLNPNHDYLLFRPEQDLLLINGQIRINGNLTLTGQGNDRTINYSGRGVFLVQGDVEIDANLITCNSGNVNNFANSFPANNIMGIMATNNMLVGASSQLQIMGAFYAQNTITTRRQTNVLGSFVANYFDMGTNVPSIYQVPALADHLPLGMIANFPIVSLQQVAWRELGID